MLLRHGQSTWNAENLFTGWVDVDLTPKGEAEARPPARCWPTSRDLDLRVVHTSVLTRAIRTAEPGPRRGRPQLAARCGGTGG